ncbi:efflux transporter, RND family, MFP subunit [Desulfarculus baarsii DSM 2075]|uniref:Efflux transporter, RND family, MFP subunit n=1 Tax=Desulfarculus baarsii (strain ATCC 33931 / DSM 2075 / LMG 7858 / VKM B-1802 / 2st14) TaxID=644282 RepID=E1QKY8_DESB2|nr:efflux RND transporter periplasmic adaptor subunit [Desulfarculus baarsii]ADK86347.1 efflux transporter, RND family, MFP subunit [Desulfarculus baarsii DSM 2075]
MSSPKSCLLAWLIVAALALLSACDGAPAADTKEANGRNLPVVQVLKIEPTTMLDALILPGETEAIEDIVLAAEHAGRVETVTVNDGDKVKKGQIVAEIDVAALKTALDRAKANYNMAADQAKRRRPLIDKGVIGREEYDKVETARLVAQGELREAQVLYNKGFVRAPIDGRVNHLHVDAGEFVDKGNPVADIVNTDQIRVNVSVPELDVRYIKVGQPSRVTMDAMPGRQWFGRIDFVAFKADPATRTFKARVVLDNADGAIRPGMICRAGFLKQTINDALAAPLSALVDKGGERLVFVEKDGVIQARTIEIGVIEAERIQIVKGLAPGDNLVVSGQEDIEDGMKVRVR